MKEISSLKIGAFVYAVKYIKDLRNGDRPLDGHIEHGDPCISVEEALSPQATIQTMLHEVIHGILLQIGRPKLLKEPELDALAFGIYQVLRDNPALAKEILK